MPDSPWQRESRTDETPLTRRSFVRAGGAGLGALGLGVTPSLAGADPTTPATRPHTDGRWLVDADGERVRLRGVATADPAFYERWHPKSPSEVAELATDDDRGWYPNVVRLPITRYYIEEEYGLDTVVEDILRPVVDLLGDRGTYALVDYHLIHPYTEQATQGGQTPDELLTSFWSRVAPEFADDEHVLYELFNEPTYPTWWGTREPDVDTPEKAWLRWREVAQPWVDLIRQEAPETPIVIGSPHWTSRTNFAPQYPFEGENLLYAAHIYPDSGQPSDFDDQYGQPAAEVPVVVTEFGWDPDSDGLDQGTNAGWGHPFREWVESYANMGWVAWCFDDSWAPHMFRSPGEGAGEPWSLKTDPEQHGGFIKQWLAETSTDILARMEPRVEEATVGERLEFGAADASGDDRWIESLSWDFGDGTSSSGWWNDHRFEDPGTYTVSLTATDNTGASTTHELGITVSGLPEPLATAEPSTTEASTGERITFEAQDNTDDERWIESLSWDFGDGSGSSGWWTEHTYDATGTYTVTLTATDNTDHSTTHEVSITVSS